MTEAFSLIVADAALVKEMKDVGPLAWCIKPQHYTTLKHDLTYLAVRALPAVVVRRIEDCFALNQASHADALCKHNICMH